MPSVEALTRIIDQLRAENDHLRSLLQAHGIAPPPVAPDVPEQPMDASSDRVVTKRSPMHEKIALLLSLFQGRQDVYARRWKSKAGRSDYSPVCVNEWKPGGCLSQKGNARIAPMQHTAPMMNGLLKITFAEGTFSAFIRCCGMIPVVSSPSISMKKTGAATCRWSLRPVAKTAFHAP